MMTTYQIVPGGKLIATYWDEEAKEWAERDVTEVAFRYLWNPVTFADGVTLRDLLLIVKEHVELFDAIIGNWCADFVEEAFSEVNLERDSSTNLQSLELSKLWEINDHWEGSVKTEKKRLDGILFPSFGGKGLDDVGNLVSYSVSLTPMNRLMDLPIFIIRNLEITNPTVQMYRTDLAIEYLEYSLGEILYGIFWEISFYGGPESRDKEYDVLMDRIQGIEDGTEELIPLDEVLERIDNMIGEDK